jgi:hypothetical protein
MLIGMNLLRIRSNGTFNYLGRKRVEQKDAMLNIQVWLLDKPNSDGFPHFSKLFAFSKVL